MVRNWGDTLSAVGIIAFRSETDIINISFDQWYPLVAFGMCMFAKKLIRKIEMVKGKNIFMYEWDKFIYQMREILYPLM